MNVAVTGGAGFIGRWVAKKLVEDGHDVCVIDNLSNSTEENISELCPKIKVFKMGDIRNTRLISEFFAKNEPDVCIHLAAQINVQKSIDYPEETFEINLVGTNNVLEECRKHETKMVNVSTCMVYDTSNASEAIDESHQLNPRSPYAASKLASDFLAMSYYHAYGLPVVVIRPFNVYGPFQKSNCEGGVVSIFIQKFLDGKKLDVFGDGSQTRDLLYVEDCADFIAKASLSKRAIGEIINAGSGKDVTIKDLALLIAEAPKRIRYTRHPHPQSEISRLLCDYSKAKKLLNWQPRASLKKGMEKTREWIQYQKLHNNLK